MPHVGATMKTEVWFTGQPPENLDCIQTDITDTGNIVIWQHRGNEINSIHLDRNTARDIAAYLLSNT